MQTNEPCGFHSTKQVKRMFNYFSERAGKRMKLAVPETWETQVSARGNKAEVWEELLDHNKLPFMAMLRNLRNMLQAGISEKHHKRVLFKLTDVVSDCGMSSFIM